MKKNILFVINNLNCGGAEKALISLFQCIDYSLYNVDLFLFKHEGIFLNKIPPQVNLLEQPKEYKYYDMSIKEAIKLCLRKGRVDIAIYRILAGFIFRLEKNRSRCEQRTWKYLSKSLPKVNKQYDAAIGFLEKNPIYYCVDKVNAKKKIGFIHNDYDKLGMEPNIDSKYFKNLDSVVTVSEECADVLKRRFPFFSEKVEVMYNIVSPKMIYKLSLEELDLNYKGKMIVSVGRLNNQKGFDLAIESCKTLVEQGYKFKLYIIGEGTERDNLQKMILENNLQNIIILLGIKENPYPYIRKADIYLQPSRFEGKSIAIDEAKILHKPIVVTNFSTAKDQIVHNENGLIVNMDSQSIAEGIERLLTDNYLSEKFSQNLSIERLGTESEIQKIYKLVN